MVGVSLIGIVVALVLLGVFAYGIYYAVKSYQNDSESDVSVEKESSIAAAKEQKPGVSANKPEAPRNRKRDRDIEL